MGNFGTFALSKTMRETLEHLGYLSPTPVQDDVIPKILRGESLSARSETGSGKTHAFLVPIIDRLNPENGLQAVIISPTRELAHQTYEFARQILVSFPLLKVSLVSGGKQIQKDEAKLTTMPNLLITTPGRLKTLAIDQPTANLSRAKVVVLDEADMLLEEGFYDTINSYISTLKNPQIMAFSATISPMLETIIKKYINPDYIAEISSVPNPNRVHHFLVDIHHQPMLKMVTDFITIKQPYLLLIFASRIPQVNTIYEHLRSLKMNVGIIHGDLTMRERQSMVKRIRQNEFQIIVASDMASRGLDLPDISDVLSVDLPPQLEFYLHRAGRTARYDKVGSSYLFLNQEETPNIQKLVAQGIIFSYLSLRDAQLFEVKNPLRPKPKHAVDTNLEREIKKAVVRERTSVVKPGYKKKVKLAVQRVKARHKRLVIKKDIRTRQIENYKKAGRQEE
jgi:ATP-dependent RNA helicase CshB